ncbi:MAG TPA: MutH/Sau3AI family endonuclease, partial [Parafilimonas sp.]|nr:MutH/Sau3AI family endonuclease [Parafilimonas sp.]
MITRVVAVQNLQKYIGQDLAKWAIKFGITTFTDTKQNKGWKGQTLERLAGLNTNNEQAPNGLGFELKSTAFHKRADIWVPKETMAITMINPALLAEVPFFKSHCWEKLKSILFCAVSWNGYHNPSSMLLNVQSFDFLEDSELINEIKADYEFIQNKLISAGFKSLTGKDGKWIQARTKGPGHGSTSRAFYA